MYSAGVCTVQYMYVCMYVCMYCTVLYYTKLVVMRMIDMIWIYYCTNLSIVSAVQIQYIKYSSSKSVNQLSMP